MEGDTIIMQEIFAFRQVGVDQPTAAPSASSSPPASAPRSWTAWNTPDTTCPRPLPPASHAQGLIPSFAPPVIVTLEPCYGRFDVHVNVDRGRRDRPGRRHGPGDVAARSASLPSSGSRASPRRRRETVARAAVSGNSAPAFRHRPRRRSIWAELVPNPENLNLLYEQADVNLTFNRSWPW